MKSFFFWWAWVKLKVYHQNKWRNHGADAGDISSTFVIFFNLNKYICICTLIIDLHYNWDNILLLNTGNVYKSELNTKGMSYSFVVKSYLPCSSERIPFSLIIDKGRSSHRSHFMSCLCVHTACKLTSFGSDKAYLTQWSAHWSSRSKWSLKSVFRYNLHACMSSLILLRMSIKLVLQNVKNVNFVEMNVNNIN